jgi:WD repeat and SOF domain-containing protein 1
MRWILQILRYTLDGTQLICYGIGFGRGRMRLFWSSPSFSSAKMMGKGDKISVIRYNPVELSLLACCAVDRGIGLHDVRTGSALRKTILSMRCNCFQLNPMEPYYFVVGKEDYNCYSFDIMRKLLAPSKIHKGHLSAVLLISWPPNYSSFFITTFCNLYCN